VPFQLIGLGDHDVEPARWPAIAKVLLQVLLGRQPQASALERINTGGGQPAPGPASNLDEDERRAVARDHIQLADAIANLARDDPQPVPLQQRARGLLGDIALPLTGAARSWHPFRTCEPVVGSRIVNNATGNLSDPKQLALRSAANMADSDNPDVWSSQPLWTASGLDQQQLPRALYVVATPIGNAADVTLRALWVLRTADCIAAEDTRVTAPLLKRYGISTRPIALHRHNEREASAKILSRLAQGDRVALVSDAGTPGISDPGAVLVRGALSAGHRVIPIPGASSLTAALSAAGLNAASVVLLGFLPAKAQARHRLLQQAAARGEGFVLFEAPHRIADTARELAAVLPPDRRVVLARELTKLFEAVVQTTAADLPRVVAEQGERGEFVLMIDSDTSPEAPAELDEVTRRWVQALAQELPAARAAAVAAKVTGLARDVVYRSLLAAR
jgi:16S rRNA (cytidine1402-2'-O)-methyltransferase